jgi:hypothetical protein
MWHAPRNKTLHTGKQKKLTQTRVGDFMKKVFAFVVIAAALVAASTLNVKIEIHTNSAYACGSGNGC